MSGATPREIRGNRRRALASGEDREEYLGFVIDREFYAVSLALVREILKPPPVTEVPRSPPDVLGIVSVRGQITTVLDLRLRLGAGAAPQTLHSRVLLVQGNDEVLGLLVDEVTQVYRLAPAEIESTSSVLGNNVGSHVAGIGRPRVRGLRNEQHSSDDEVLILLDLASLLG